MDNSEFDYDNSDDEISEKHSQLLKSIEKLDKIQRIKKPERSEPTLQVSEFHLVNSGITDNDAVCVDELVKNLDGRTHYKDISRKFKTTKKQAPVLPKPLEKPAADKLKRAVGFENTAKELDKWNAIITRNRVAPKQVFPLSQPSMRMKTTDEFVKRFRVQSELEKELDALEPEKPKEIDGKTNDFALTLAEMKIKRLEAARFRAQQSYKHAKAHRQKKIKSKKFHRIERSIKVKEQLKEFAKLQETDPQAALEKLNELSRARAEERMSLKHKNTSKWAQNKQIRAKYDIQSREALAEQLAISRDLMQKIKEPDSSDDEITEDNIATAKMSAVTSNNPWVNNGKTESEVEKFVEGYRKYWDKIHEENMKKKEGQSADNEDENISLSETQPKKDYELSKKKIKASMNPVVEVIQQSPDIDNSCKKKKKRDSKSQSDNKKLAKNKVVTEEKMSNKNKTASKKISREIKKAGTSEWSVETLDSNTQSENLGVTKSLAIDDMFDAIEDKMKQKFKNKLKRVKRKLTEVSVEESENDEDDDKNRHVTDLSFKKMRLRPEVNGPLDETTGQEVPQHSAISSNDASATNNSSLTAQSVKAKNSTLEIDPNVFMKLKSHHLKKQVTKNDEANLNDVSDDNNDEDEEDDTQRNLIREAFADDDVVEEFMKEKAEEVEKSKLENIDLRLPGWGDWGGKNIKKSTRKKRRFILKFPKNPPRNDENKGNVILIQDNSTVKKHLVNDVPYPFSSVSDFETSIRAPIGRNFVPENAHKNLTQPAVRTKMGKIIEPMDEDVLVENKNIKTNGNLMRRSKNNLTKKNSNFKKQKR